MHSGLSPCPWARGTDALCYFSYVLLIVFFVYFGVTTFSPLRSSSRERACSGGWEV